MICVSIGERSLNEAFSLMNDAEMVEIRADLCKFTVEEITFLVGSHPNVLFTCRLSDDIEYARQRMVAAIEAGAAYVDIEIEAPKEYSDFIREKAKEHNTKFIVSYHDFETTSDDLLTIYDECCKRGADIVKIVTTANSTQDAVKTLSLYKQNLKNPLLAFSMGKYGKFTRVLSLTMGAAFTYVASSEYQLTAPGQYTKSEMERILSGDDSEFKAPKLSDTIFVEDDISVKIPASKSIAQRAILAAALSSGESILTNYEPCNDISMAVEVIKKIGAKVTILSDRLVIKGSDNINKLNSIHIGESGLLTRLMMPMSGYFTELSGNCIDITGHGSILNRSIQESVDALSSAGLDCRSDNGHLPLNIYGAISSERIEIDGAKTSQIVSGFLMTLPLLSRDTVFIVKNPTSIPYIYLTLDMLKQFGIKVNITEKTDERIVFEIKGNQKYIANTITLDSDWSSAAFFAVAGRIAEVLHPEKHFVLESMPTGTSQADEAIVEVLNQCGTNYPLSPFCVDATNSPDLFPILAVLACHCEGMSEIKGVCRLSQKESNRAEAIYYEFTKLGAEIDIIDDIMYIKGSTIKGGRVSSHNDHRMAMSFIIASLFTDEDIYLDDVKCIDKSFPTFLEKLTVR